MSKKTRDKTQPTDWHAVVAEARDQLERVGHGGRRQMMAKIAARAGIAEGVLRKGLAAARWLEQVQAEGVVLPVSLQRAPIGVVDVVSRWAEHDREAAIDAGTAHVRGEMTFRELLRAEIAARPGDAKVRPARMLDVHVAWKTEVISRLRSFGLFANLTIIAPSETDLPVDAWVANPTDGHRRGAIIVVGPYRDDSNYDRDLETWIWRSVGLATRAGHIWLAVPTAAHAKNYRERLAHWSISSAHVEVVALMRPPELTKMIRPKGV